jgi:threonine synthase
MNYYSLSDKNLRATFREAALQGQAEDGGLYFPERIPKFSRQFLSNIKKSTKEEIGLEVMSPYAGECIPEKFLLPIIRNAVNFPIPLVPLYDGIHALELFHGPTMAFKDVGARFMSGCFSYFMKDENNPLTVLVATSGDTGGAVANGFLDTEGVNVVILFPSGKVSAIQELQLTRQGGNIMALEIEGDFDECQQLVKQAFADKEITLRRKLTSANSINIARWLPQQLYYFLAWQQWEANDPFVISVPSGNFGNLCAGMLAQCSGLPVKHFIAACNANDTVPRFLQNGQYNAKSSIPTISNAMDVGNPNNFVRILELFNHNTEDLRRYLSGYSISDEQTKEAIADVYHRTGYLMDPHGAVAYITLKMHMNAAGLKAGVFLETAHPVKFEAVVPEAAQQAFPEMVAALKQKESKSIRMKPDFRQLKDFLMT